MDVRPEYETFGREIPFEEITPIRKVEQPGILSQTRFFNQEALSKAIYDLHFPSQDNLLVYFRNIAGGMGFKEPDEKRKWWDGIREFGGCLKEFPAGIQMSYWYGPDGKQYSSPEFDEEKKPYQAFIRLFDNAIQGFSCFVGGNREGISFNSERTNYHTIKPGEGLIHDQKTRWIGKKEALLDSAERLSHALYNMSANMNIGIAGYNGHRAEVRIISSMGGALVGSLVGSDSATLFIDHSSLEQIVQKYNEKRQFIESLLRPENYPKSGILRL